MKILVLGGAGFVGQSILARCLESSHAVTAITSRKVVDQPFLEEVSWRRLDRSTTEVLGLGREGWDAVIDVTGTRPHEVARSTETLGVASASYVLISSCTVLEVLESGQSLSLGHRKPYGASGSSRYGWMKAMCEESTRKQFPDTHLIVRPCTVVGRGDPYSCVDYWLDRTRGHGAFIAPEPKARLLQLLDVRDLAEATLSLLESDVVGEHVVAPPPVQFDEFLQFCSPGSVERAVWTDPDWLRTFVEPIVGMPLWHGNETRHRAGSNFSGMEVGHVLSGGYRPLPETLDWVASSRSRRESARSREWMSRDREQKLLSWLST